MFQSRKSSEQNTSKCRCKRSQYEMLEGRRLLAGVVTSLVRDINLGDANPDYMTDINGTVFFVADDGVSGAELWKSNGTVAGTVLVRDIRAGASGSFADLDGVTFDPLFTDVNGTAFFLADDGVNGLSLWKSDGTANGTLLVRNLSAGGMLPSHFTNVNGTLFFSMHDENGLGQLWKSNGTAAGTGVVRDLSPLDLSIYQLTNVNGSLFLSVDYELWKSDGTSAGTVRVRDFETQGFTPSELTNINGTLFFAGDDQIWKSDGTSGGTSRVRDFGPQGLYVSNLINVNGALFFNAYDDLGYGRLWRSDGTNAGTVLVRDFSSQGLYLSDFTSVNSTLFFKVTDDSGLAELWKSDGTASSTVKLSDLGYADPLPTNVNGTLFFVAQDAQDDTELWMSNGTVAGTRRVADIAPGDLSSNPSGLTASNGSLYFAADDGTNGVELWSAYYDATAPTVNSALFEFDTAQSLHLTFSEPLNPARLALNQVLAANSSTGTTISPASVQWSADYRTARFFFSHLPDGSYAFTLKAGSMVDFADNTSGVDLRLSSSAFFVLAGDANRDRAVNFSDLLILAQNYGATGKSFSQGNFNYDAAGLVNFDDLLILAQNYGDVAISAPDLRLVTAGYNYVDLAWDWSGDQSRLLGFRIEMIGGNGWGEVVTVAPGVRAARIPSLALNTLYSFRISAVSLQGEVSPVSNPVNAQTLNLAAPMITAATGISPSQIRVDFAYNGSIEHFELEQQVSGGSWTFAENIPGSLRSVLRTGLLVNTAYNFRMRAVLADGQKSAYSSVISGRTQAGNVPTSFRTTGIGSTAVSFAWNYGDDPLRFEIWQRVGGGSWTLGENVPGNVRAATRTALEPSTAYSFRIRAVFSADASNASDFTDPPLAVTTPALAAPTNLRVTALATTSIRVAWDFTGSIDYFELYQRTDSSGWVLGENVGRDFRSAERTGLAPGTQYYFQIRAVYLDGRRSAFSNEVAGRTTEVSPPSNLRVTGTSTNSLTAAWDYGTNPDYFVMEQSTDGSNWVFGENIPGTARSAVRQSLSVNTLYYLRVRAVDSSGHASAWSNVVSARTDNVSPPSNLRVTGATTSSLTAAWDYGSNPSYFVMEQSTDGVNWAFGENIPGTARSAVRQSLAANTLYYLRVRAVDFSGNASAWSNVTSSRTLDPRPVAPSGLTSTGAGAHYINVRWNDNSNNEVRFEIYVRRDGTSTWHFEENVPANTEAARIDYERQNGPVLAANTYYWIRIRAIGPESAASGWSNEIRVRTAAARSSLLSGVSTGDSGDNSGISQASEAQRVAPESPMPITKKRQAKKGSIMSNLDLE